MSGYLEVKYPFKTNLYPFKTWKRQWCILRPSPTCSGGGSLAVYCSEAGASAGAVELPPDSVVRLAKSRSRPHAFAVFSLMEPHKPRILLAAQTFQDAQIWMDKIRALLEGKQLLGTELLKDSYSVTIIATPLARKLGLSGDGVLSLSAAGALISRTQKLDTLIEWKHIRGTTQTIDIYKNKICAVNLHSYQGGGSLKLSTPVAEELDAALRQQLEGRVRKSKRLSRSEGDLRRSTAEDDMGEVRRSSWSTGGPAEVALDDTDLLMLKDSKRIPSGQLSRCAAAGHLPSAPASPVTPATPATPAAPPTPAPTPQRSRLVASATIDDCMSDRRSLLSIASGIYEEIPDLPDSLYTKMTRDVVDGPTKPTSQCDRGRCTNQCAGGKYIKSDAPKSISLCDWGKCSYQRNGEKCSIQCDGAKAKCSFQCDKGMFSCQLEGEAGVSDSKRSAGAGKCPRASVEEAIRLEEPTYESVAECVYATMRRTGKRCPPPPLPPRLPFGTMKLGSSWNSRMNSPGDGVTRHSSLGSLPRCCSVSSASSADSHKTKTLPKDRTRQAFSVFRKRLKSDSRVVSPKSETAKENKDVETKKKKFDFTPTRDIFKSFKVGRKMKNLKITPGGLSKAGETKSCEFLDETEHVTAARCSKSVECLEGADEFADDADGDLSLEFNDDAVAALALPQEIMELILRSERLSQLRSKMNEGDYMPMSPIVPPPPIEHHYITMSPRTNLA